MSRRWRLTAPEPSEFQSQRALVSALRSYAPADLLWFHIPNQNNEGPARGKQLKDMGRLAGVSDLCFIRGGWTLFLELKDSKQEQTPVQKEFERRALLAGASYKLVRSEKEAHRALFEGGFMDRDLLRSA